MKEWFRQKCIVYRKSYAVREGESGEHMGDGLFIRVLALFHYSISLSG